MIENIVDYFVTQPHKNSWCHTKLFNVEGKHWALFHNMYDSISDKIQQKIISKVYNVFIFYHIVLIHSSLF
jgi:hypothetical protein